jgi:replication factor C large subunit
MTHHCKNRELTVAMAARYELSEKHVSFVTGSGEDTNKVESIVADAQALREEVAMENAGGAFDDAHAGEAEIGDEAGEDESTAEEDDGDAAAQASLAGSAADDSDDGTGGGETVRADAEGEADDGPDKEEVAEDDDQQSGLSDFM